MILAFFCGLVILSAATPPLKAHDRVKDPLWRLLFRQEKTCSLPLRILYLDSTRSRPFRRREN